MNTVTFLPLTHSGLYSIYCNTIQTIFSHTLSQFGINTRLTQFIINYHSLSIFMSWRQKTVYRKTVKIKNLHVSEDNNCNPTFTHHQKGGHMELSSYPGNAGKLQTTVYTQSTTQMVPCQREKQQIMQLPSEIALNSY